MKKPVEGPIGRRELLVRTVPACAMACLGLGRVPGLAGALPGPLCQEVHKFDEKLDRQFSTRELSESAARVYMQVIRTLRKEMDEGEVIRLLELTSAEMGRQAGERHAQAVPDRSFPTFATSLKQNLSGPSLTFEVMEETDAAFELRVSECIWETLFREAGLAGEIGHAAVCNMDYAWPPAFNPAFKMERSKTLMQGHECCNHRYIDTSHT